MAELALTKEPTKIEITDDLARRRLTLAVAKGGAKVLVSDSPSMDPLLVQIGAGESASIVAETHLYARSLGESKLTIS